MKVFSHKRDHRRGSGCTNERECSFICSNGLTVSALKGTFSLKKGLVVIFSFCVDTEHWRHGDHTSTAGEIDTMHVLALAKGHIELKIIWCFLVIQKLCRYTFPHTQAVALSWVFWGFFVCFFLNYNFTWFIVLFYIWFSCLVSWLGFCEFHPLFASVSLWHGPSMPTTLVVSLLVTRHSSTFIYDTHVAWVYSTMPLVSQLSVQLLPVLFRMYMSPK